MKKRNTGKKIAKYVVIAIILFVLLFPVYWMINCSLLPSNVIMSVPPRFFPINATLKNFSQIFTRASYLRFFQNSFIVSFGTIAIVLLVAVPASYALSRYNFFGRRVILSSVSSVQMFPVVVILTTLYGFYNSWHMLDTYRGLILADTTFALPLAITLMKSFFDTLSKSLDEAARIDGASRMRVLLHILLPLVVPGLVAVGIYTFLNAWEGRLSDGADHYEVQRNAHAARGHCPELPGRVLQRLRRTDGVCCGRFSAHRSAFHFLPEVSGVRNDRRCGKGLIYGISFQRRGTRCFCGTESLRVGERPAGAEPVLG